RYIRDSFWPTAFVDLADVNQQAVIWRDTVANIRIHGTTHERPQSRFPDEKLQRLPKHRYLLAYSALRKVLNDCRISWNASLYSVPWQYVEKMC
ncbi:integrase, partial [Listeria monocytogenes]